MDLKKIVRDIPDFPKPGIVFKDITPLLQNPEAFKYIVDSFVQRYREKPVDVIVGIESRGFLFGSVLAYVLGKSFAIMRKKGKLPYTTVSYTYKLEYGEDTIELHEDAIPKGSRVLIVDDLLATGGTAAAAAHLVEKMGGKVAELAFVIELAFLNGRKALGDYPVFSLIDY
ncbi:adenine phosphoribosyltransferase [Deltaproteobacteria bacterium PRO3]|nr:adenine phosphoribosyltransferase [Deltaproteobacteria bacterium PRO3]